MACEIIVNAKMRRPGICGATETLLIDRDISGNVLPIINALIESGCELRGDDETRALDNRMVKATEEDWRTEYLNLYCPSVRSTGWKVQLITSTPTALITRIRSSPRTPPQRKVYECRRLCDRDAQRIDPVRRWRRVRHGRGNRPIDRWLHSTADGDVEQLTPFWRRSRRRAGSPLKTITDIRRRGHSVTGLRVGILGGSFNPLMKATGILAYSR